ncbi:hypothetical protein ACQJBY_070371 [Aegilops geniculata]
MRRRPARARAAVAPAPAPRSPPAAMGGLPSTPAPSPSTSVSLGLAADDGALKSPAVEAPRRSLRLAGAASPGTPAAASSDRDGASSGARGRRRGRPRASAVAAAAASPEAGQAGSDGGGGGEARASGGTGGGSSGQGTRRSLRSGPRLGKRAVEPDVHAEVGLVPDGGGSGSGDKVHDEMLHQDADGTAKRRKGVSARPADYVADSESDSEDDFVLPAKGSPSTLAGVAADYVPDSESDREDFVLPGDRSLKVPANLFTPFNLTEPSVVAMGSHITGQGIGQVNDSDEQLFSEDLLEKAAGGIVKPLASAADKAFADVDFSEEVLRHESGNRGEGNSKLVLGNNDSGAAVSVGIPSGTRTRKFSRDDKGKGKMVAEEVLLPQKLSDDDMDWEPVVLQENQSVSGAADADVEPLWRQAARERAIKLAPKFAFFKADEDVHSDEDDEEELEPAADAQDWPGPYSTALRIMDDRDAKLRARELGLSSKLHNDADNVILWTPLKNKKAPLRPVPSLASLCMQTLASHAEGIESLGGIPEELKHKLLTELCRSRKMNTHLLTEILCDNPVALRLRECSWLNEDDFEAVFGKCMTESLEVLQLDLSGRCMPDYILPATLAKAPNCMPLLRKISLMGNYRLSDNGLDQLISSAPSLSSLNLSECSLLTSTGIENLASRLQSVLRELYINDCLNVDAMTILPALKKIKHLEVLSMSGIQSVCDKFVNELIPIHGSNIRELAFAGCLKLTSSSIKTIGVNCPQLSSLDIRNLNRLRDSATRHLRDGCRLIKQLKLQKNAFSDVALSQFLEESGGCLTELSLNNIEKVGNLTARAIATKCSLRLEILDVSFCRGLTNEALGLIVDSCSSLRTLKLFGCTQITDIFLKGHSNSLVKIIGIEGSILEQLGRC